MKWGASSTIYKFAAICWAVAILFLSSLPTTAASTPFIWIDEVRHALFYGLLSFFMVRSLYPEKRITLHRLLGITLLVAGLGTVDELHQGLFGIAGRQASILDWVADILGGFVVAFVMWQREVGDFVAALAMRPGWSRRTSRHRGAWKVTNCDGILKFIHRGNVD